MPSSTAAAVITNSSGAVAGTRYLGSVRVPAAAVDAKREQGAAAATGSSSKIGPRVERSPNISEDFLMSPNDGMDDVGEATMLALLQMAGEDPVQPAKKEEVRRDFQPASQYLTEELEVASVLSDSDVVNASVVTPGTLAKSGPANKSSFSNLSLNTQERLEMKNWGLPELVLMRYEQKGISTMFPWQTECLSLGNVLRGGNLVYSAPTSAGKTLVAEMLLIKRVLETKKKGIFILPFISLAREKMFGLQDLLRDCHVRVCGFMGTQAPQGGLKRTDIAVCTIEKANSLINRLLEEDTLSDLGVVVVDELHLLGDPSRGYLLELLLTKIRYMSYKEPNCDIQIIGMSATLPNLDLLATWLNADLYKTDFRPVPLTENIKVGTKIYNSQFEFVRNIEPEVQLKGDTDNVIYLCLETILAGHSVLVFCPTKAWCEKLAAAVAKEFHRLGSSKAQGASEAAVTKKIREQLKREQLSEVMEQLRRCPAGLDENMSKVISFGVAYHHAGLTLDERDIIEGSFKSGALRVLAATSTLSSGVNLPARRVIVRCPFSFRNELIETLAYKQMVGRAGRKGVDTEGESILLCRDNERARVAELVGAPLQPVASCLALGNGESIGSAMKRAILEVVSSGAASTSDEVEKYASCTMLAASLIQESKATDGCISNCIKFLEENEFIRLQNSDGSSGTQYIPSQLGLACLASSLSPDEGLAVFAELQKARKCFVLENELHIIYQVVPINGNDTWQNMDWMNYLNIWESLPTDMKRVGDLVGVEETFLVRAMRGTHAKDNPKQKKALKIHLRFFSALALHDLVNEVSLRAVSEKYGTTKGALQTLQQNSSTFAGMVTVFCHKLGWLNLELLLGQFQERLHFGVHRELIDLCRLNTLNGQRARVLHDAKMESVAMLANSRVADVENVLQNSAPFESKKQGEDETVREATRRKEIRSFWVTGLKGMTYSEAAIAIVQEARDLLQRDLGISIDFDSPEQVENNRSLLASLNGSKVKSSEKSRFSRNKKLGGHAARKKGTGLKVRKAGLQTSYRNNLSTHTAAIKNFVLNSTTKRRSSDNGIALAAKIAKVEQQKLPRDLCSTPTTKAASPNQDPSAATAPNILPQNSATKCEFSFDLSGEMDDIFGQEADDCVKKKRKKDSAVAASASPSLRNGTPSRKLLSEEEDMFGDSFANISAIDNLLHKYDAQPVTEQNNSCPKTPNLLVCNSEELLLRSGSKTETPKSISDVVMDHSLTDSFLERALNSHMSAEEDSADEAAAGSEVVTCSRLQQHPKSGLFAMPSPPPPSTVCDTPKSCDSSSRLSKRRQTQRALRQKSKISPGLLILSDSDSDSALRDSPLARQNGGDPLPSQCEDLRVVDVCSNKELFTTFVQEWKSKRFFSVALACVKAAEEQGKEGIGARLMKRKGPKAQKQDTNPSEMETLTLSEMGVIIVGVAVSWEAFDAYYLSLSSWKNPDDLDDSLAPPTQDETISLAEKISAVKSILEVDDSKSIVIFDSKEHYKHLYLGLGLTMSHRNSILDPKVALWMLQPVEKEKNLTNIVMNYDQESVGLLPTLGSAGGCGSVALNGLSGQSSGRLRSVAEAVISRRVMEKIEKDLKEANMWKTFKDVEMRSMLTLARMELNGVGFSLEESERQRKLITARMEELEAEAYRLAGHVFSLTSIEDICQILYQELKLPINGDPSLSHRPSIRAVQGRSRNTKANPSTNKDVLIKLKAYHELPGVILEWRKLNMSIAKVVFPMQKARLTHSVLKMDRIYTTCQTQSSTGRISLYEPNIQNIPRDFDIVMTDKLREKALGKREGKLLGSSSAAHGGSNISRSLITSLSSLLEEPSHNSENRYLVSMRHAIVPAEGFIVLAADYSQLELRLLAHFSDDPKLKKILNDGKDVFKSIAASWKRKPAEAVTDDERQQAKQICYGMVYGIGTKSLGEQLDVVEQEASVFLSDFRSAYPGIKRFMDETLVKCKKLGYVETLNGRRRYLPSITAGANQFSRAAAERQAVNTTIQGSAADLAKTAMNGIDRRLSECFPECRRPLRMTKMDPKRSLETKGAYFMLQMHDELLYEVACSDVMQVAQIVKMVMENSCKLSVSTPVKIKIGPSWGQLQDLKDF